MVSISATVFRLGSRAMSSTSTTTSTSAATMSAWQWHAFGKEPILDRNLASPTIRRPTDVLIDIHAASVNPIDVRMSGGYGATLFGLLRQKEKGSLYSVSPFPLILGRDCSGVVREIGADVHKFKVGDEVFCAVPAHHPGTHAERVLVDADICAMKPSNVTHVQAASLPYVAATVHAALTRFGGITASRFAGLRVLLHGASGGIGTFACQLLNAWGATVVGTCSQNAFPLVESLGAAPVDYLDEQSAFECLTDMGPFDVVLDPVGSLLTKRTVDLLGIWRGSVYVTLLSPLLFDTDSYGAIFGLIKTAATFGCSAIQPMSKGRWFTYGYFIPNGDALEEVRRFVEEGKIKPIVDKEYNFSALPEAYDRVAELHGRGKTIITMQ